jgi:hypothetical protein
MAAAESKECSHAFCPTRGGTGRSTEAIEIADFAFVRDCPHNFSTREID